MSYSIQNVLPERIPFAQYLFHRLRQLDVHTIFGLPGEFNMQLLDNLCAVPDLRWAGNTNELNAAYAADGYARVKKMGCLLTTFGVGELSAINGIAGSFSESVGVVHIVGMPPLSIRTKQLLLHHTLGNGDYNVFHRMASEIACYTTIITQTDTCCQEIDKAIIMAYSKQKPVYIGVPSNFVGELVRSNLLDSPLKLDSLASDQRVLRKVTDEILNACYKAKKPAIIADACIARQSAANEVKELYERLGFPIFVTPMAKGSVEEVDNPLYGGVFSGTISAPQVKEIVDYADFVLVIGCTLPKFRTSSFQFSYKAKSTILLLANTVKIKNYVYPDINLRHVLQGLLLHLDESRITHQKREQPAIIAADIVQSDDEPLRQERVWSRISSWFEENDVIITETGTAAFGITQTTFPKGAIGISQTLWGSTGYTIGAALGACFATEDLQKKNPDSKQRRVILFIGDGALQSTVQEISTMLRWDLKLYIFVLNNQGYSGDKVLYQGGNEAFYDIQQWDYLSILDVFGARNYETMRLSKVGDFKRMLSDPQLRKCDKMRMIEVILPPSDVPHSLLNRPSEHEINTSLSMNESTSSVRDSISRIPKRRRTCVSKKKKSA